MLWLGQKWSVLAAVTVDYLCPVVYLFSAGLLVLLEAGLCGGYVKNGGNVRRVSQSFFFYIMALSISPGQIIIITRFPKNKSMCISNSYYFQCIIQHRAIFFLKLILHFPSLYFIMESHIKIIFNPFELFVIFCGIWVILFVSHVHLVCVECVCFYLFFA